MDGGDSENRNQDKEILIACATLIANIGIGYIGNIGIGYIGNSVIKRIGIGYIGNSGIQCIGIGCIGIGYIGNSFIFIPITIILFIMEFIYIMTIYNIN